MKKEEILKCINFQHYPMHNAKGEILYPCSQYETALHIEQVSRSKFPHLKTIIKKDDDIEGFYNVIVFYE